MNSAATTGTGRVFCLAVFLLAGLFLGCQPSELGETTTNSQQNRNDVNSQSTSVSQTLVNRTVEASCGQCQFGMEGVGCDLAIRIDGHTYWVDGSDIDEHGDAHGAAGLCNCVRQAVVDGEIVGNRIKVTSIKLEDKAKSGD